MTTETGTAEKTAEGPLVLECISGPHRINLGGVNPYLAIAAFVAAIKDKALGDLREIYYPEVPESKVKELLEETFLIQGNQAHMNDFLRAGHFLESGLIDKIDWLFKPLSGITVVRTRWPVIKGRYSSFKETRTAGVALKPTGHIILMAAHPSTNPKKTKGIFTCGHMDLANSLYLLNMANHHLKARG